jgi:hypothetical protein
MRTTLNLRDDLLRKARELTGVQEKTALVHLGLEALLQKVASERLARLGGSDRAARAPRRRRLAGVRRRRET